jgi:sentrin-specific protease 8
MSAVRLSYHAAALYQEDIDLLRPGMWLNDNVMVFWMEYLQHDGHAARRHVAFFHPGAVFMCLFERGTELADAFAGLRLAEHDLLLLPVNNNTDPTLAEAGSHWSLLSYERTTDTWVHWDSSLRGSSNLQVAHRVAEALAPLVTGGASSGGAGSQAVPVVRVGRMPQQANGSDCGVHALLVADVLAATLAQPDAGNGPASIPCDRAAAVTSVAQAEASLAVRATPEAVVAYRAQMAAVAARLCFPATVGGKATAAGNAP